MDRYIKKVNTTCCCLTAQMNWSGRLRLLHDCSEEIWVVANVLWLHLAEWFNELKHHRIPAYCTRRKCLAFAQSRFMWLPMTLMRNPINRGSGDAAACCMGHSVTPTKFERPGVGRRRVSFVLHRPEHRNGTNVPSHFAMAEHRIHWHIRFVMSRWAQVGMTYDAGKAEDATVPCKTACRSHRPRRTSSACKRHDRQCQCIRCSGAYRLQNS